MTFSLLTEIFSDTGENNLQYLFYMLLSVVWESELGIPCKHLKRIQKNRVLSYGIEENISYFVWQMGKLLQRIETET